MNTCIKTQILLTGLSIFIFNCAMPMDDASKAAKAARQQEDTKQYKSTQEERQKFLDESKQKEINSMMEKEGISRKTAEKLYQDMLDLESGKIPQKQTPQPSTSATKIQEGIKPVPAYAAPKLGMTGTVIKKTAKEEIKTLNDKIAKNNQDIAAMQKALKEQLKIANNKKSPNQLNAKSWIKTAQKQITQTNLKNVALNRNVITQLSAEVKKNPTAENKKALKKAQASLKLSQKQLVPQLKATTKLVTQAKRNLKKLSQALQKITVTKKQLQADLENKPDKEITEAKIKALEKKETDLKDRQVDETQKNADLLKEQRTLTQAIK